MAYGEAVRSRLADLGVAAIPLAFGLFGPGEHVADWSLPLSAAISVSLCSRYGTWLFTVDQKSQVNNVQPERCS
jgi:hypothetical protein